MKTGSRLWRESSPPQRRSRWPFLRVAFALFVTLMAANLATPLYAVYRHKFGFSQLELTVIFATYALVLIPSLLIFGQLSDSVGRRRVMAAGMVAGAISLALFALARGTVWLFAARAGQGISTGLMSAAAAAALVELEPGGHHGRAAVAIVIANTAGSGSGPVVAGALAQWAPDRLVLVYLAGIALLLLALLGVLWTRDAVVPTGRWRLQRPAVPANVTGRFARAGLSGAVGWSVGALFLSVVPSYAALLLHTNDLALLGAISGLMLIASGAAQVVLLRADPQPRRAQPAGLVALGLGIGLLVLAFPLHSLVVLMAAAAVAGLGLGFALFGAQKDINRLAPGLRRGEVTAAFITCLYGGAALTAISAGLLADSYGLSTAVAISGGVLAAVAAATTVWHVMAQTPLAERLEEVT